MSQFCTCCSLSLIKYFTFFSSVLLFSPLGVSEKCAVCVNSAVFLKGYFTAWLHEFKWVILCSNIITLHYSLCYIQVFLSCPIFLCSFPFLIFLNVTLLTALTGMYHNSTSSLFYALPSYSLTETTEKMIITPGSSFICKWLLQYSFMNW